MQEFFFGGGGLRFPQTDTQTSGALVGLCQELEMRSTSRTARAACHDASPEESTRNID
jgi:hypothetical protein